MTLTIHLPDPIEQAYLAAARARGVSVDALVNDVLLSHVPSTDSKQQMEQQWTEEDGIPVLCTGQALSPSVVEETLTLIRLERDQLALGE